MTKDDCHEAPGHYVFAGTVDVTGHPVGDGQLAVLRDGDAVLLDGEMGHEDSAGDRGWLGPGDVQWMTAGRGIVHSEMPSQRHLEADERAQALLLSGVPLGEPVVQYGPFVMSNEREIIAAIGDYQSRRLGEIAR